MLHSCLLGVVDVKIKNELICANSSYLEMALYKTIIIIIIFDVKLPGFTT